VDSPQRLRSNLFGRKVVFHLRHVNEAFADDIRKLSFVKDAQIVENKIVVTLDDPETNNPEIIRTLVTSGGDIQFVGELRHSLEDVYLRLMHASD
jgi:ABC-2 type transport system ATP-binding protein